MEVDLLSHIGESFKILIPVVYIIGVVLKNVKAVKDNYIPIILIGVSILFSVAIDKNININGVVQGILIAGVCVLGNQVYVQMFKKPKEEAVQEINKAEEEKEEAEV